jgi:hypothetical protein
MAANSLASVLPTRSIVKVQQRSSEARPMFSSSFIKGSGRQFAGQSLHLQASNAASTSSRRVTTMAAKGENRSLRDFYTVKYPRRAQCAILGPLARLVIVLLWRRWKCLPSGVASVHPPVQQSIRPPF